MVPVRISAARSWVAGPQHSQRQARATGGDRRQHSMQTDGALSAAQSVQLAVDPGLRLVQPASGRQRQPLCQPADSVLVGEPDRCAAQAVAIVDPHRVGRGDQNIGGPVRPQQRVQNAGPGEFGLQYPQAAEHLGVAKQPTGLRPDRRGDRRSAAAVPIRRPAARGRVRSVRRSCRVHHRVLL